FNTSAQLAALLNDETGTGSAVFANAPTLVAPVLGAATATTLNRISFPSPNSTAVISMLDSVQLSVVSSTIIGKGQYLATTTSDSASTGNIGEVLTNSV